MSRRASIPKALDPGTVRAIIIAFDDAAEALRHRGESCAELPPQTRASLARTVIELAEHGLHDPVLLKDAALARFRMPKAPR